MKPSEPEDHPKEGEPLTPEERAKLADEAHTAFLQKIWRTVAQVNAERRAKLQEDATRHREPPA